MKINNSNPPVPVQIGGQSSVAGVKQESGAPKAASASPSFSVDRLNPALSDASQDVNNLRVQEVRQAIIEGRLQIDTGKIADSLLDNLKGL